MGATPSHRAARRSAGGDGQLPPIQTGGRGRCTGVGRNVAALLGPRREVGDPARIHELIDVGHADPVAHAGMVRAVKQNGYDAEQEIELLFARMRGCLSS
jgi:hypothetical protein